MHFHVIFSLPGIFSAPALKTCFSGPDFFAEAGWQNQRSTQAVNI